MNATSGACGAHTHSHNGVPCNGHHHSHGHSGGHTENKSNNMISSDKPYVCDICGRGYSYLASLEQHKATHMTDHQHQCNGCGRLFKNKDELEAHKLTHNSDGNETRPHQCETCGRRFTLLENLHRHQMIHTDERPFGCHYCHKRFRLAQHLKEHIRIHTGEKPYKCNICGRAFCQISNLKSHQKTHTKVKAFECDICHKTFRRSFTLKQHKLIHEREGKTAPVPAIQAAQAKATKPVLPTATLPTSLPASITEIKTESTSCCPTTNIKKETEDNIEVDVCGVDHSMNPTSINSQSAERMSPTSSSPTTNDTFDDAAAVEQRKEQLSPLSNTNSDSGHGSPNHSSSKLDSATSEEEATNSGSDDSGNIAKTQRFYRPFEDSSSSPQIEKPVPSWPGVDRLQAAGTKRVAQTESVDITQTKRIRDNNGKVVVYPGIRETTSRINPTSTLDELRQTTMNGPHWESLRPDQEFLWRRLGRGQETVTPSADSSNPELVPVVEWRPIVVGYRSLKDGSVTNRDDIPQPSVQPNTLKTHPFFANGIPNMVFPQMPVSQ
jgi:DNA-directed RNA polymerase subunit RPC12/RpoP